MGLLPIFLTLALFIFLWGLVNYNSFVAKQNNVQALKENHRQLTQLFPEAAAILAERIRTAHAMVLPANLVTSPPQTQDVEEDYIFSRVEEWQRFLNLHPSLLSDDQINQQMKVMEETATQQLRTFARLQAATRDYNQHCQKMPYRLIALLFGFHPIHFPA